MEQLNLYDRYIEKLNNAPLMEQNDIKALIEDITRVLIDEDEVRLLCLDYYNPYSGKKDNFKSDIRKLKTKLEYKRAVLVDEIEKSKQKAESEREQQELEKLRLQVELKKSNITINNSNTNENHNDIAISFDAVRDSINSMTSLPYEDVEEIQNKINEIEKIVKSKDSKNKKWSNAKEIIKWIADKGVDVGIALLPLLLKIS